MEILLIACMLAYVAGAQTEQSKLGLSPAQRATMREQTRHEKAVQRIAEKHGEAAVPPAQGVSPWKQTQTSGRERGSTTPDTFMSGYRSRRPGRPPLGQRAGELAGKGVTWAQDTGKDAWRSYRERRKREGDNGPELVMVPIPPDHPPTIPPVPTYPPTAGIGIADRINGPPQEPDEPVEPEEPEEPEQAPGVPESQAEPPATAGRSPDGESDWADVYAWTDKEEDPAETLEPPPITAPEPEWVPPTPREPEETPEQVTDIAVEGARQALANARFHGVPEATAPETTTPAPDPGTAQTGNGVGRMAAEVTYESVMDESDELHLMCEDDVRVSDRIHARAEREIGRGDDLIAALENAGFGPSVIAGVARCKEQYGVIYSEVDDLKTNTIAQGEAVVKAKALLEAGQGVYADIAKDMESVAERESYISDAVDAEDTDAHTEVYETKAA